MSSCGSNADMESGDVCALINAVVNNALFHSKSRINQILPQVINILHFFGRLAALYFQINVLRSGLFSGQKSEVHTSLLHYCTFGLGAANDAQDVRADTAHRKDNDQQNLSKMIM